MTFVRWGLHLIDFAYVYFWKHLPVTSTRSPIFFDAFIHGIYLKVSLLIRKVIIFYKICLFTAFIYIQFDTILIDNIFILIVNNMN